MKEAITRSLLYLLLGAGLGATGTYYYLGSPEVQVLTNTRTKTIEKIITKREIIRETSPDGTVTEKITEDEKLDRQGIEQDKSRSPDQNVSQARAAKILQQSTYSLSLQWDFGADTLKDWQDAWQPSGAIVGRRVWEDLWGELGYDWQDKEFTLGVRLEF